MANAIEAVLNRASQEQRDRAQQVIEEARRNIKLVSNRDDIPTTGVDSVSKNTHTIEEARRVIPFETMKDVDSIDPPLNTSLPRGNYNSTVVEIHSNTQSNIESIEQGEGNNYLRENAVNRAMARPERNIEQEEKQQALGR